MKEKIKIRIEELEKELLLIESHADSLSWKHNFQEKEANYARRDTLRSVIEELKCMIQD